ncbi:MAG TPA: GDSL-type esterase/lipase family protein [Solirubrobacteraceae bacterium]
MAPATDAPAGAADRRVLFFGDSFVAGTGDPTGLGWVGRVVASSYAAGVALTAYNLGIRGDTSVQVAARWRAEARPRMVAPASYGVVFGFGVNDAVLEDGRVRVDPRRALDSLGRVLDDSAAIGLRPLVVGPAPAGEVADDARVGALSASFQRLAADRGVPFVAVFDALSQSSQWARDVAGGDGVHPGAAGYAALAQLVLKGGWLRWLSWKRTASQPDYLVSRASQHPHEVCRSSTHTWTSCSLRWRTSSASTTGTTARAGARVTSRPARCWRSKPATPKGAPATGRWPTCASSC